MEIITLSCIPAVDLRIRLKLIFIVDYEQQKRKYKLWLKGKIMSSQFKFIYCPLILLGLCSFEVWLLLGEFFIYNYMHVDIHSNCFYCCHITYNSLIWTLLITLFNRKLWKELITYFPWYRMDHLTKWHV
jgi:hypothetical protein